MPFRIDVLDAALAPERQRALADVLAAHGVEPELADLVSAMTPGTVAEVGEAAARDRLVTALAAAGFAVRAGGTGLPVPSTKQAVTCVEPPLPVVQPNVSGGAVRAVVGVLLLIAVMTAAAGMCGPPQDAYPESDYGVAEGRADSLEASMESSMMADTMMIEDSIMDGTIMEDPAVSYSSAMMEDAGDQVADSLRDEADAMIDGFRNRSSGATDTLGEEYGSGTAWRVESSDGYVNMRLWPRITSRIIERVSDGSILTVHRCNATDSTGRLWCKVNVDGRWGWVAESYI